MPALVATLFVLATSVYGLGTLSVSVPRWIVVYVFACVALCRFVVWAWRRPSIVLDRTDAAALALYAYIALSLAWTPDWRQGVYSLINVTAIFVVAMWVRHARESLMAMLPGAAVFGLFVAFIGQQVAPWDFGGHGNRNFQAELMVVVMALGLACVNAGARMAAVMCSLPAIAYLVLENDSKVEWFVVLFLLPVVAWRTFRYLRATASP